MPFKLKLKPWSIKLVYSEIKVLSACAFSLRNATIIFFVMQQSLETEDPPSIRLTEQHPFSTSNIYKKHSASLVDIFVLHCEICLARWARTGWIANNTRHSRETVSQFRQTKTKWPTRPSHNVEFICRGYFFKLTHVFLELPSNLYSLVFLKCLNSSLVGKCANLCRHLHGNSPQILCQSCAVQILHTPCTFFMPPRMFRTFPGICGTTLRTNLAQFSQTRGMFLRSACTNK